MKKLFGIIGVAALLATIISLTGCVTKRTTETGKLINNPDGTSYATNWTKTTVIKGEDPLKDKVDRLTTETKGIYLKTLASPAGTSSGLSPIELMFGWDRRTWTSYPVYPGVATGYTPPFSLASSAGGSLWNSSENESMASKAGLNPTNAYYQSTPATATVLQQLGGTVTGKTTTTTTGTNGVTTTVTGG